MQSLLEGFRQFVSRLPAGQRVAIAAVFVGGLGILGGVAWWASQPDYALLFGRLAPTSASRIVDALRDDNVKYQLKENGTAVYVPREKVYELRLQFASENIASDATTGYELFDQGSLGMTDFMQKLNLRRALEGELSRTISSLRQVEVARVHLVLPERSPFRQTQSEPSSSVVLRFAGADRLSPGQIEGIASLVAGAVEGLSATRVTVLDTAGNILTSPGASEGSLALSTSQLRITKEVEDHLTEKGQTMLDQFLGPGNAIVRVAGELDFSKSVSQRQSIDPESATVISEERVEQEEDTANGTSMLRNYDVTRTNERSESGAFRIANLSVSLVVNEKVRPNEEDPEGAPIVEEYSAEELAELEQVVKNAVGFDQSRGDIFAIHQRQFDTSSQDNIANEFAAAERSRQFQVIGRYVVMILAMLVGLWFLRTSLNKVASMNFPTAPEALTAGSNGNGAPQLTGGDQAASLSSGLSQSNAAELAEAADLYKSKLSAEAQARLKAKSVIFDEIVADIAEKPEQTAELLRSWLAEDKSREAYAQAA
ncbi:MAG: flagellar M-ring protein FliF [Bacteroidetes bacterium]|nr:flagellar M-ring protein FliF [Bacteroidota bacterium]